nr:aliphatic sulfonate ABC transporter substrate-binding protein [Texcoconibacillus texcoconensis]
MTACGEGSASGEDVNIGYFPNLDHAAGIVGKEKGYFEDEMGDRPVEFQNFPNGNDFIDALDGGSIDIGYVGPGPAINYYLSGGEIVVIGAAANGATLLVSQEDTDIHNIEDLDGHAFGTPGNGCTHNVQLEIMMKEEGLESSRIGGTVDHQSHVAPASSVGMFEQGELDAYAAPEPWGTLLEQEHNANVISEWDEVFLGEELASVVLVTTPEYLEENPEEVDNVLRAHKKSVEFTQENTDETLATVNNLIYDLTQNELPEEVLVKAWDRLEVTTETHADALQDWATASYELNFLEEEPDLDGFVDTSRLDSILDEE